MKPPVSPLDQCASIPVLRRLLAAKVFLPPEEDGFEARIRRELPWAVCLDRGLLSLGVVLILAGIGYFFAHNWDHLTAADKLGLAGGSVFLSLVAATWAGFGRFVGKPLLLAASALVGVFIAVFGQIYQTGADSYELFTGWAFLIFPWVVLGRFMPLWIFWVVLLNLALGFYWPVTPFFLFEDWSLFRYEALSLLLLNGAALAIREAADLLPQPWFDRSWSKPLLLAATVAPASAETIAEILHTWDSGATTNAAFLAVLLYAVFVAGLGYYYSRARYSLPALALITLGACTTLTFLVIRVLDFDVNYRSTGIWFVAGVIILAIFGAGVWFLRTQRLAHQPHA